MYFIHAYLKFHPEYIWSNSHISPPFHSSVVSPTLLMHWSLLSVLVFHLLLSSPTFFVPSFLSSSPSSFLKLLVLPGRGIYFGDPCSQFLREVLAVQLDNILLLLSVDMQHWNGPGETGVKSLLDRHSLSENIQTWYGFCWSPLMVRHLVRHKKRCEWWRKGLDGCKTRAMQPLWAVCSDLDWAGLAVDEESYCIRVCVRCVCLPHRVPACVLKSSGLVIRWRLGQNRYLTNFLVMFCRWCIVHHEGCTHTYTRVCTHVHTCTHKIHLQD